MKVRIAYSDLASGARREPGGKCTRQRRTRVAFAGGALERFCRVHCCCSVDRRRPCSRARDRAHRLGLCDVGTSATQGLAVGKLWGEDAERRPRMRIEDVVERGGFICHCDASPKARNDDS
jgi:hypothetical protein